MKKIFASAVVFASLFGIFSFSETAHACDTLEKVTIDGISYTRVHQSPEPCPAAPAQTASVPSKPAGAVLSAELGPAAVPRLSNQTGSFSASSAGSGKPNTTLGTAKEFDCGDPSTGGALGEAFSGFIDDISGRIGREGLDSVLSGLGNSGTAGRIISDVFHSGAGSLVNSASDAAGSYVGSAVQSACGDSRLCGAAGRIIGNAAGHIVQNVGQNALSSITGSLGKSGGFGGAVAGLLGGDGGGALGSVVGGAIGLNVPVADSGTKSAVEQGTQSIVSKDQEILGQATELNNQSKVLLRKECVSKPAAMALINRQIEQDSAKAIQEGSQHAVVNQKDFDAAIANTEAQDFISKVQDPDLRAKLTAYVTERNDPTPANCQQNNSNPIVRLFAISFSHDDCTASGRETKAKIALNAAQSSAIKRADDELTRNQGFTDAGSCRNHPDITQRELCPSGDWQVGVPGSLIKDQVSKGVSAPTDRLLNTHDTGEIINDAFNQLLDEIFATVGDEVSGGIRSLGNRVGTSIGNGLGGGSRNNGGNYNGNIGGSTGNITSGDTTTGGGSYTDVLTQPALTPAEMSALVSQNIANSASVESAYRTTLETMITNLQAVSDIFSNIHTCYQTLANGTPTAITQAEALSRSNTASTTVGIIFKTQIDDRKAQLAISLNAADKLTILSNQAAGTTDAGDLAALGSAYQGMIDAHEAHTNADLQSLLDDMNADANALQILGDDATQQLTACRAIH